MTGNHKALAQSIQTSVHKLVLFKLPKGTIKASSCLTSSLWIFRDSAESRKQKQAMKEITHFFLIYFPTPNSWSVLIILQWEIKLHRPIQPRFLCQVLSSNISIPSSCGHKTRAHRQEERVIDTPVNPSNSANSFHTQETNHVSLLQMEKEPIKSIPYPSAK